MYELFYDLAVRPEPFSQYTAKKLWTSPFLARQMLGFHLNQETELASRPVKQIDRVVEWIDSRLNLFGKRLCDLGCGPGLYAERFAGKGANVVGIDFSGHALNYARSKSKGSATYLQADYLEDDLPEGFDVITLIYTDLCALSPEQRGILLDRMKGMLNPEGYIVIDVAGMSSFVNKEETTIIEYKLMDGFWAAGNYVGIQKTFLYPDEAVSLDHFLIIEPDNSWDIYNWFQHFTPGEIEAELLSAGFEVEEMAGDLNGTPLSPGSDLIGIIARKA